MESLEPIKATMVAKPVTAKHGRYIKVHDEGAKNGRREHCDYMLETQQ